MSINASTCGIKDCLTQLIIIIIIIIIIIRNLYSAIMPLGGYRGAESHLHTHDTDMHIANTTDDAQ